MWVNFDSPLRENMEKSSKGGFVVYYLLEPTKNTQQISTNVLTAMFQGRAKVEY